MKIIINLAVACALTLSSAACASSTKSLNDADMALKSAMKANSAAKKLYVEWRDTGKILKAANKAKADGDFDKAVTLAGKAERQALNAVAQHKAQKNIKPRI